MEIEFEGLFNSKYIFERVALTERPSRKIFFVRLVPTLFLCVILVPIATYVYQSENIFSRSTILVLILSFAIYYLTLHPYIAPFLAVAQSDRQASSKDFRKGTVSANGITYVFSNKVEKTPWKDIYKAKKTDELIILFTENSTPMAFPRRFFKTDVDWQQFNRWTDYYVKEL